MPLIDRDPDSQVATFVAPQDFANQNLIPQVAGHDAALLLCGISIALCAGYFLSPAYQSASTMKKLFISLVTLCYSVSTILMMVRTGRAAVSQHRDRVFFVTITAVDVIFDFASESTGILTQIFLTRRAYTFARRIGESPFLRTSKPRIVSRVILLGATLSIAATCAGFFAYITLAIKKHPTINPTNRPELRGFFLSLVSSAVTDIIVSASLAWDWFAYLNHERDLSSGTESILRRLVAFTLTTTLYTTLPAVVAAAVMLGTSQLVAGTSNTAWIVFSHLLPSLYFITLLTMLALRDSLHSNQTPTLQQRTLPTVGQNMTQSSPRGAGFGRVV